MTRVRCDVGCGHGTRVESHPSGCQSGIVVLSSCVRDPVARLPASRAANSQSLMISMLLPFERGVARVDHRRADDRSGVHAGGAPESCLPLHTAQDASASATTHLEGPPLGPHPDPRADGRWCSCGLGAVGSGRSPASTPTGPTATAPTQGRSRRQRLAGAADSAGLLERDSLTTGHLGDRG
jgi:hypothetical protein